LFTSVLIITILCLLLWPGLLTKIEALAEHHAPGLHLHCRRAVHRYQADLERRYPSPTKKLP
jgi:hypothetical protein